MWPDSIFLKIDRVSKYRPPQESWRKGPSRESFRHSESFGVMMNGKYAKLYKSLRSIAVDMPRRYSFSTAGSIRCPFCHRNVFPDEYYLRVLLADMLRSLPGRGRGRPIKGQGPSLTVESAVLSENNGQAELVVRYVSPARHERAKPWGKRMYSEKRCLPCIFFKNVSHFALHLVTTGILWVIGVIGIVVLDSIACRYTMGGWSAWK